MRVEQRVGALGLVAIPVPRPFPDLEAVDPRLLDAVTVDNDREVRIEPVGGGGNRDPGAGRRRALLGDACRASGASDPDRDVRVLDAVLCRFGGRSIVAGGVRGGDGRVVWATAPSFPGENTRIETFVFVTPSCVATATALSSTVLSAASGAVTEVVAVAPAAFACSTAPLSPGLPTRTVTAVFCVSVCVAAAAAAADWSLATGAEVSATAVASAPAAAWFSCETGGPFPGLSTLTLDWLLPTPCWCDSAAAFAACETELLCSLPLPGSPPLPAAAPWPAAGVPESAVLGAAAALGGPSAAWRGPLEAFGVLGGPSAWRGPLEGFGVLGGPSAAWRGPLEAFGVLGPPGAFGGVDSPAAG